MLPQSIQGQVPKNPSDPRFNRNSSAHLDGINIEGIIVNIDQVTDPAHKSKLCDLTQLSTISMSSWVRSIKYIPA